MLSITSIRFTLNSTFISVVLRTLRLNNTRISECSVKNWSWIAETGRFDFMDILYI
ncbi:hypothetical protein WN944_008798 [Citrus x changshan-huyou]|uniref:Uncharacterized protein n=1 Tax=Citrus x changshan-huyou TaxID=2935761 RepID=A0AAP0MRA0_9ROSI